MQTKTIFCFLYSQNECEYLPRHIVEISITIFHLVFFFVLMLNIRELNNGLSHKKKN